MRENIGLNPGPHFDRDHPTISLDGREFSGDMPKSVRPPDPSQLAPETRPNDRRRSSIRTYLFDFASLIPHRIDQVLTGDHVAVHQTAQVAYDQETKEYEVSVDSYRFIPEPWQEQLAAGVAIDG